MSGARVYRLFYMSILLFFVWLGVAFVVGTAAEIRCYAAGFPDVRMSAVLVPYCVRRVNQTDTIVAAWRVR